MIKNIGRRNRKACFIPCWTSSFNIYEIEKSSEDISEKLPCSKIASNKEKVDFDFIDGCLEMCEKVTFRRDFWWSLGFLGGKEISVEGSLDCFGANMRVNTFVEWGSSGDMLHGREKVTRRRGLWSSSGFLGERSHSRGFLGHTGAQRLDVDLLPAKKVLDSPESQRERTFLTGVTGDGGDDTAEMSSASPPRARRIVTIFDESWNLALSSTMISSLWEASSGANTSSFMKLSRDNSCPWRESNGGVEPQLVFRNRLMRFELHMMSASCKNE